jgi:hypothetical protein
MGEPVAIVPGRACGSCSLCCKLLRIEELDKPAGVWCPHCQAGLGGCKIYGVRPGPCRSFHCAWLINPELGPEWRPTAKAPRRARRSRLSFTMAERTVLSPAKGVGLRRCGFGRANRRVHQRQGNRRASEQGRRHWRFHTWGPPCGYPKSDPRRAGL